MSDFTLEEVRDYHFTDKDFKKRPLSYSSLKHILKSPLHFSYNRHHRKPPSAVMELGKLVDCLLFEPDQYQKRFAVMPEFSGTGSVKARKDWREEHKEMSHVKKDDVKKAEMMVNAIKTNPKTKWLYEATTSVQLKVKWTDSKTGLPVLGYLDAIAEKNGKPIIWDLKTTTDASRDQYERQAANMQYHLQAGTYTTGLVRNFGQFADFYQVVVETSEPFACNTFRAASDFVRIGKDQFRKAMDRVRFCIDNHCFNEGYDFLDHIGYEEVDLPFYIKRQLDD